MPPETECESRRLKCTRPTRSFTFDLISLALKDSSVKNTSPRLPIQGLGSGLVFRVSAIISVGQKKNEGHSAPSLVFVLSQQGKNSAGHFTRLR